MAHVRKTEVLAAPRGGSIDDPEIARWLGQRNGDAVRDGLARGGIQLHDPHRGTLKSRHFTANAVLEADDLIQIRSASEAVHQPAEALRRGAGLPGNVRFALRGTQWRLAAETRVDGAVHLADSLDEIKRGFLSLLGKSAKHGNDQPPADIPPDAGMKSAIEEAGWTREQAVETEDGWELHPRISGTPFPVRAVLAADSVTLRRTVIGDLVQRESAPAAAHQALLQNERLRFCRLALIEESLVVETTLRAGLIGGGWLAYAAQAVASAARGVEPELKLLTEEPAVAQAYAEMFLA
jgi:hypothetical protein